SSARSSSRGSSARTVRTRWPSASWASSRSSAWSSRSSPGGRNTPDSPRRSSSAHLDEGAVGQGAGGDGLADDRGAGDLADDEEAAGGLGVGEEDQLVLADAVGRQVGSDPVEVALRAARDVAGREGRAGTLDVGHRSSVDPGGDAGGTGHLVQVPEQTEAGDVGRCENTRGESGAGGVPVER